MDGFETTKVLREIGYKGYLFGVTATTEPGDIDLFRQNGVTEVLFKPLSLETLSLMIESKK